jgi:hypothetical protein
LAPSKLTGALIKFASLPKVVELCNFLHVFVSTVSQDFPDKIAAYYDEKMCACGGLQNIPHQSAKGTTVVHYMYRY